MLHGGEGPRDAGLASSRVQLLATRPTRHHVLWWVVTRMADLALQGVRWHVLRQPERSLAVRYNLEITSHVHGRRAQALITTTGRERFTIDRIEAERPVLSFVKCSF
jgi:hypothetical protein